MDDKYYLNDLESDSLERKMEKFAEAVQEANAIKKIVEDIDMEIYAVGRAWIPERAKELNERFDNLTAKKEKVWNDMFAADDILVRLYLSLAQHFSKDVVDEHGDTMKEFDREAMKTAISVQHPGTVELYDEIFEFVDDLYEVMANRE